MTPASAPTPCSQVTACVSTGCAVHCVLCAWRQQLAASPGAGISKARLETDHKQAQIGPPVLQAQPVAHEHLFTAARVACVTLDWAPTGDPAFAWQLAGGPGPDPKFKHTVLTGRPQASPGEPEGLGCLEYACQAPPQPAAVEGLLGKGMVRRTRGIYGALVC